MECSRYNIGSLVLRKKKLNLVICGGEVAMSAERLVLSQYQGKKGAENIFRAGLALAQGKT